MLSRSTAALGLSATLGLAACQTTVAREPFEDSVDRVVQTHALKATVDRLAEPLIQSGRNIGMVIAVATPAGDWLESYGSEDLAGKKKMPRDAVFQVGSVSKSFTSALAAELAVEQRLDLNAPVNSLLPAEITPHAPAFREITLAQLASHTAGLPHEDYNYDLLRGVVSYLVTGESLYRYFTQETLLDYVRDRDFSPAATRGYAYSNLGMTYMGWLLGQVDGKGYNAQLHEKILGPLGLKHTGLSLRDGSDKVLTPGYAGDLPTFVGRHAPVPPWLFDEGIAGAGGLQSTAADLLVYAKANLGLIETPLFRALQRTHQPIAPAEGGQIAMSWFIKTLPDTGLPYTYIAGIIGGHTSFVGFDEKRKIAVVVLQNSINHDDMIGVMLLDRLVGAALAQERKVPGRLVKAPQKARAPQLAHLPRDQYSK